MNDKAEQTEDPKNLIVVGVVGAVLVGYTVRSSADIRLGEGLPIELRKAWRFHESLSVGNNGINQQLFMTPIYGADGPISIKIKEATSWYFPADEGCEKKFLMIMDEVSRAGVAARAKASGIVLATPPPPAHMPPPR